jgi:CotH protein/parallel beta helix pectate lyase-like protein
VIVYNNKSQSEIVKYLKTRLRASWKWSLKKITIKWWIVLIVLGLIGGSKILNKKNVPARLKLKVDLIKESLITGYYRATVSPKESLILDIGFKQVKKIQDKRNEAIGRGVLFASRADLVSADIRYKDENIPVKIRLKGDWLDHLSTNKWSLRLETDEDKPFKGMRHFSLQVPEARVFINEWLFLKTIKDEGLIGLNYDFLKVSINGETQGIYALEEHFSKEVIERNEKREGPILNFNADQFWNTVSKFGGKGRFPARESLVDGYYFKSLVDAFQQTQLKEDPVLANLLQLAVNKLQAYREGTLPPKQVFDYQAWSKYMVLTDLFGADHGFFWENYRFYYNPVSGLFEPVPFDNEPGKMIEYLAIHESEPAEPLTQLLEDEEFIKEYVKQLKTYSNQEFIGEKISQYAEEIDYYTKLLRQDYPNYSFEPMSFFENADFMRQSMLTEQGVRVSVTNEVEETNSLVVENLLKFPIEILAVQDLEENNLLVEDKAVLQGTDIYDVPERIIIELSRAIKTDKTSLQGIKVSYGLLGLNEKVGSSSVGVKDSLIKKINFTDGFLPETTDFIKYDTLTNSYVVQAGNWSLDKLIVIPQGAKLIIMAGAKINITGGGGIVSYSPINIDGNELEPVIFSSSDRQGQGLLVLSPKEKSIINYAKFIGLTPIESVNYKTSGAVNFYEAEVEINHTQFIENQAEDQLNIIRSKVKLDNVSMIRSMSDGIDFDFSNGQIIDSSFVEMGNDAVDFSGSQVEIEGLMVDGAGDKGISVGERSQVLVNRATIKNARLGVASKDLSEVILDKEIVFENLEVGLAAYQKKPEYGPAIINQDLINATKVQTDFLIEKGSILQQPWNTVVKGTEKKLGEKFQ